MTDFLFILYTNISKMQQQKNIETGVALSGTDKRELLLPKGTSGKLPTVVCCHGFSARGKEQAAKLSYDFIESKGRN